MATSKELQMAKFYSTCLEKGYTDMTDDKIQLKAKVVASDLNLNYGKDVAVFFEKSKACYETVEKENKEKAEKQRQQEKEAKRKAAMKSELILTLANKNNKIEVYLREDNSVYHKFNAGEPLDGSPEISVRDSKVYQATYHPSKAVYTGATVGGITTGGIHYTKPSYSEKVSGTGNGYVTARAKGQEKAIDLRTATVTNTIAKKYKHHGNFKLIFPDKKTCLCYNEVGDRAYSDTPSMLSGKSAMEVMSTMSIMKDFSCLDIKKCEVISDVLHSIANANFPPTDEELYQEAIKLSSSSASEELELALNIFNELSYFKDSEERAKELGNKYEEAVQREKEEAIIRKEKTQKKIKLIAIIAAIVAAVIIAVIIAIPILQKSAVYNEAVQLLEDDKYDEAKELFEDLGSFKDSHEMRSEADYQRGLDLFEKGYYSYAVEEFEKLYDYKDSRTMVTESKYQSAVQAIKKGTYFTAIDTFEELGDYKDSEEQYKEAVYLCAKQYYDMGSSYEALTQFNKIPGYKDVDSYISGYSDLVVSFRSAGGEFIEIEYDENGKMVNAQSSGSDISSFKFTFNENGIITGATYRNGMYTDNYTVEYLEDGTVLLRKGGTPELLFDKYGNLTAYYSEDVRLPIGLWDAGLDEQNNPVNYADIEYEENGNLSKITYKYFSKHYWVEPKYEMLPCNSDECKEINENNVRLMFHISMQIETWV